MTQFKKELKAIDIIKECVSSDRLSKRENKRLNWENQRLMQNFHKLNVIYQFISEDEYLESKKKNKGEIFGEYMKQKEEIGKKPRDVLQEFIDEELKDYMNFKGSDAFQYDAVVQKYTSQFLASRRRKAKFLSL